VANQAGFTPLMMASSIQGHVEIVRSILYHPLGRGAINGTISNGCTALWYGPMTLGVAPKMQSEDGLGSNYPLLGRPLAWFCIQLKACSSSTNLAQVA
jgi:hypothetical protein